MQLASLITYNYLYTGSLLDIDTFEKFYALFIFDLTKQENLDADHKFSFNYTLSGTPGNEVEDPYIFGNHELLLKKVYKLILLLEDQL